MPRYNLYLGTFFENLLLTRLSEHRYKNAGLQVLIGSLFKQYDPIAVSSL
jgi:hypothetical protein